MVRINEYGEIIRDASPPQAPPPPPTPTRRDNDGIVFGMMILGALLLGALGALAGYGAGERWCATDYVTSNSWSGMRNILHSLFVASWSADPVHHALQDVSMPVRLLLAVVVALGMAFAAFSERPPDENGGCATVFGVLLVALLFAILCSALVRVLVFALAYPVTWFLDGIEGPWTGLFVVGLCWGVIGGALGLIVGAIAKANG